ncbi:MAG: TatD family hydrolase [Oscillospiraceae bacterium]|nr:TatD family hydrolase [Oscillospiraceae bacterium]
MRYKNLFDSHAHYADSSFDKDREILLNKILPESGIAYIMLAGVALSDCLQSQELAKKYNYIYCSAGIHPEQIQDLPENWLEQIEMLASYPKCMAIGEIGLDYYHQQENKNLQKEIFIKQLELAKKLDLPVILHIRDAMGDAMEILKFYQPKGVLHCYNGSAETARELLKINHLYFSFSGVITYKNVRKPVEALKILPLDKIMLETDSPYLAPEPYRHKRCDSRMIIHTAQKMAEIKNITTQELVTICCENAKRLFQIA